jgi:hypothetical protein
MYEMEPAGSKTCSCLVLELPEAVTRSILMDWMELKSVVRTDSACCNRALRLTFLSCAYGEASVYLLGSHYYFTHHVRCAVWSLLRGARLGGTLIGGTLAADAQLREQFFSSQKGRVRQVEIHEDCHQSCGHTLRDVAKWCPNVEELKVYGDPAQRHKILEWEDGLLAFKKACGQLHSLTIRILPVSASALSSVLSQCSILQSLTLGYSFVPLPTEIAVPSLTYLDITDAVVPEAAMIALGARCCNLRTLWVFDNDFVRGRHTVTNAGMRAVLQGCPLLRETDVEYAAAISTELRVELAGRCNFEELTFGAWRDSSDQLAQGVLKVSPALTKVSFAYCSWLTGTTLAVCAVHCPLLEICRLSDSILASEELVQLFRAGSNLRGIICYKCSELDDHVGLAIAENCPLLDTLDCTGSQLTDTAVVRLAQGCPLLSGVALTDTVVGDAGVVALATHSHKLSHLFLRGCSNVTLQGLRSLATRSLDHLELPVGFKRRGHSVVERR